MSASIRSWSNIARTLRLDHGVTLDTEQLPFPWVVRCDFKTGRDLIIREKLGCGQLCVEWSFILEYGTIKQTQQPITRIHTYTRRHRFVQGKAGAKAILIRRNGTAWAILDRLKKCAQVIGLVEQVEKEFRHLEPNCSALVYRNPKKALNVDAGPAARAEVLARADLRDLEHVLFTRATGRKALLFSGHDVWVLGHFSQVQDVGPFLDGCCFNSDGDLGDSYRCKVNWEPHNVDVVWCCRERRRVDIFLTTMMCGSETKRK